MIGELAFYLYIMAIDPEKGERYLIENTEVASAAECTYKQIPWYKKAEEVKRGNWRLIVGCIFNHEEGQPVNLTPETPPQVQELLQLREADSSSQQVPLPKPKPPQKHKSARSRPVQ